MGDSGGARSGEEEELMHYGSLKMLLLLQVPGAGGGAGRAAGGGFGGSLRFSMRSLCAPKLHPGATPFLYQGSSAIQRRHRVCADTTYPR